MILTHLKFLKLFSWTFVFIFANIFWVCLFPRNFWPTKERRKIEKIIFFLVRILRGFWPKKIFFSIFFDFFSKTSIMEAVYINVETWILHQFRRLYPQNFRFYPYFVNLVKKSDFVCFPYFYGIIYIYNIQKMMTYIYIKKYSWETDKLKLFFLNINFKHNLNIWWYYHSN